MTITLLLHEKGNHPRMYENIEVDAMPAVNDIVTASDGPRIVVAVPPVLYQGLPLVSTRPAP